MNSNSSSDNDHLECSADAILDLRDASLDEITTMFYSQADKLMILVCFTLLCVVGVVGNFAFLLVVAMIEGMQTKTNFYLANLAVADLIFILAQVYENLITYLISPRVKSLAYYTPAGCGIMFTAIFASHFASVAFMVLMAFERYLAICKPLSHRMVVAKGRTVKLVVLAWLFGVVYAVAFVSPHFFVVNKSCIFWPDEEEYANLPKFTITCVPLHSAYEAFPYIVQAFPYLTALISCVYMYACIVHNLSTRLTVVGEKTSENSVFDKKAKRLRNQVARLLIANATVFFACHLPHFMLRFNDALLIFTDNQVGWHLSQSTWYILFWFNRALGTANSVVNPLIYSATNARYRRAFWTVFTCRWNVKASADNSSTATAMKSLSNI